MNKTADDASDNKGSNSKNIELQRNGQVVQPPAEPSPALIGSGLTVPGRPDLEVNARTTIKVEDSSPNLIGELLPANKSQRDGTAQSTASTTLKPENQQPSVGDRNDPVKSNDKGPSNSATGADANILTPAAKTTSLDVGPKGGQQHPEPLPSNTKITPDAGPAKATVPALGDGQVRANQPAGGQTADNFAQAPAKLAPVEAKTSDGVRPATKDVVAPNVEPTYSQPKNAVTNAIANPADRPTSAGDVFAARTNANQVAPQIVGQQKADAAPVAAQIARVSGDSPSGNVSNPGLKQGAKPDASDIAPVSGGSQVKSEQVQGDLLGAPAKIDPKGDVFNTQGAPIQANRQDVAKGVDSKIEAGRPAEQVGSKDPAPYRDPRSAGVLNETFGQKTEAGSRVEPSSQLAGNKQDTVSSGQKADQITKDIQGRVNEGARQPGATDGASSGGRQPGIESGGKSQGIAEGAQPGIKQSGATDGATATGKQPIAAEGSGPTVRQPNEAGDKGSSGGGGSLTAESTKRIDAGMGAGGKAEGQTASGGMGGGSSAPVDRAPHKPFSVEDAGATKSGEGAGGKAGDVVGGKASDVAGVKGAAGAGSGAGPRFDTGEVRGTEPGARFDSGEMKDGRSTGTQAGGKSGEGAGIKGTESGIVKGTDVSGTKGAVGGSQGVGGSGGSSEAGILGDKRQPSLMPDGILNQGGKTGKVGDGISGGGGILGTDVPFVVPGSLSGKEGGRRQSDQIFTDKGKAEAAPVGKQDAVAAAGKSDSAGPAGRSDQIAPGGKGEAGGLVGKGEPAVPGGKSEPAGPGGKGEAGGVAGKGEQPRDFKDKGQKADVGIPAAMAGQIGAGAAEVGGVLKNFAQSVLSDGKTPAQAGDGTPISKDARDASKAPLAIDGSGKEVQSVRQDFAGPGKKTQILPTDQAPGAKVVGPGGTPIDASAKKIEPLASGSAAFASGAEGIAAGGRDDDGDIVPLEEFNLPEIDVVSEADEAEEVKEIEESVEAKIEDEMHYELALGLQLYTSIAEAQYGAYHYYTKEGDTVESVSREIVGDVRCSPLVFSLNKEHIVASTEYGVHPFKVGVMVQLPTPRDLKEFFGEQK